MKQRIGVALAVAAILVAAPPALAQGAARCSFDGPPAAHPRVERGVLDGLPYVVLLPTGYAQEDPTVRHPVLYLLHGGYYNESTWLAQTDLLAFTANATGAQAPIVVMPDGGPGGFYTDWEDGSQQWETFHLRRLVPHIDATYRTLAARAHRAIAGFSLGGFGAMHYAARHPGLFVAAASLSGLLHLTFPRPAYGGPSPVSERSGAGAPAAAAEPPARPAYVPPTDAGSGCGRSSPFGTFGSPVTQEIAWHAHNPTDLAPNLGGVRVFVGAGSGVPCPGEPVTPDKGLMGPAEPAAQLMARDFSAALTAAGVAHVTDLDGCGLHDMVAAQRLLHGFWPHMAAAFGASPPQRFDHRSTDRSFDVHGWRFTADPRRAREFLEVDDARASSFTLIGSGTVTVTTPARYAPGQRVAVQGALPAHATADGDGRLRVRVDLGPPHRSAQFAPDAARAVFVRRRVTFTP